MYVVYVWYVSHIICDYVYVMYAEYVLYVSLYVFVFVCYVC